MANRFGWKCPKTRQEMAASLDEDHAPFVRVKRRFRNLPDYYDDIPRGRRGRPDKYKDKR
jgi:hypothetical protein